MHSTAAALLLLLCCCCCCTAPALLLLPVLLLLLSCCSAAADSYRGAPTTHFVATQRFHGRPLQIIGNSRKKEPNKEVTGRERERAEFERSNSARSVVHDRFQEKSVRRAELNSLCWIGDAFPLCSVVSVWLA